MSVPGGYRVPASDFERIDQNFYCSSCGYVMRLAMQTDCGHLYCNACLDEIKRHQNPACAARTDCGKSCGKSLEQMQAFADIFVRREIDNIKVNCINVAAGCDWNHYLKFYDDHQNECPWRPMDCGNWGCTREIPVCKLAAHEKEECHYRKVTCQHCHSVTTIGNLQNHLEVCPDFLVSCANCGMENIPRCQLNLHTDPLDGSCTQNSCPFREFGCTSEELMSRENMALHLREKVNEHLCLLVAHVAGSSHQNHNPEGITQGLGEAQATRIADHSWALSNHNWRIQELDGEVKTLLNALVGVKEGFEQSQMAQTQEIAALKNEVEGLKAKVARQDEMINALYQWLRSFGHAAHRSGNN